MKLVIGRSFDRATLLARLDGSEALLREISGLFVLDAPHLMGAVRDTVARGDAAGLWRAAHSLKGTTATLAAENARAEAARLERMGRDGDLSGAAAVVAELEGCIERLRQDLAQEAAS